MLHRIIKLTALPHFRLDIEFEDGAAGTIDLSSELYGPMFEPLRDDAFFRSAYLDEYGVVCWPNGADYAPDTMYEMINGKSSRHPSDRPADTAVPPAARRQR
jgi:hypothetical protein